MSIVESIKLLCLFVAIFFTLVNLARMAYRQDIPFFNMLLWAAGLAGFVYTQWFM